MTEVHLDSSMIGDVSGKVAIVTGKCKTSDFKLRLTHVYSTGGATGIGEAVVSLLAKLSATTYILDINAKAGQTLASLYSR